MKSFLIFLLVLVSSSLTYAQSFLLPDGLMFQGEDLSVYDLHTRPGGGYQVLAEKVAYGYFHSSLQSWYDSTGNLSRAQNTEVNGLLEAGKILSQHRLFFAGQNTTDPIAPWGLGGFHAVFDSTGAPLWYRDSLAPVKALILRDTLLLLQHRLPPTLEAVSLHTGKRYWHARPGQWRQKLNLPVHFRLPENSVVDTWADKWVTSLRDSAGQLERILLLNAQGQAQAQWLSTQSPVTHIGLHKGRVFTIEGAVIGGQDYGTLCAYDTTGTLLYQKDLNPELNLSFRPQDAFRPELLQFEPGLNKGGLFLALHKAAAQEMSYHLSYYYFNAQGNAHAMRQVDTAFLNTGGMQASHLRAKAGPAFISTIESEHSQYWLLRGEVPASALDVGSAARHVQKLYVAPNPVSQGLHLRLPQPSSLQMPYRLHGLTGQMYQRGQLRFSGGEATLDLSELAPGTYFLILEAGEKRYRARVLVER